MKCMLNENKLSQIHLDNASYRPNHRMPTVCVIIEIQHSVEKIAINTSTFLTNTDTGNTPIQNNAKTLNSNAHNISIPS